MAQAQARRERDGARERGRARAIVAANRSASVSIGDSFCGDDKYSVQSLGRVLGLRVGCKTCARTHAENNNYDIEAQANIYRIRDGRPGTELGSAATGSLLARLTTTP